MQSICMLVLLCLLALAARSQEATSLADKVVGFPDKFFGSIDKRAAKLERKLSISSEKYLKKLHRQESRMKKILAKSDSAAAKQLFGDIDKQYADLKSRVSSNLPSALPLEYNANYDSLHTALKFLSNKDSKMVPDKISAANTALSRYTAAQSKLNATRFIENHIKERQSLIRDKLKSTAMMKSFQQLRKQTYYYRDQVKQYKDALNNPKELGKKALTCLNKVPAFKQFMQRHSILSQMFPTPEGDLSFAGSLAGLQTRADVQQLAQNGYAPVNQPSSGALTQSLQSAQNELKGMRDKLNELRGNKEDLTLPDFTVNPQKTKKFLDRLELGTNLQTVKSNGYFPASSDIGLSAGYKLNDKSVLGIGGSFKMGLGTGIRNLAFSAEGFSMRSFFDYKVRKSFWLTAGMERTYRAQITHLAQLADISAWSNSALVGLSKKYKLKKKIKGEFKILYDVLWNRQIPAGQPIIFRTGYSFK